MWVQSGLISTPLRWSHISALLDGVILCLSLSLLSITCLSCAIPSLWFISLTGLTHLAMRHPLHGLVHPFMCIHHMVLTYLFCGVSRICQQSRPRGLSWCLLRRYRPGTLTPSFVGMVTTDSRGIPGCRTLYGQPGSTPIVRDWSNSVCVPCFVVFQQMGVKYISLAKTVSVITHK